MGNIDNITTYGEMKFIDREKPQRLFFTEYVNRKDVLGKNNEQGQKNRLIISFVGYGGVGKSKLVQQLIKRLKTEYHNSTVIRYDFGTSTAKIKVIFKLKQLLISGCDFSFPDTDLAQCIYALINGDNPVIPKIKSKIEESSKRRICFKLFGELPIVGIIFKGIETWDEVCAIVQNEDTKGQLSQLKNDASLDLEDKIQNLFIEELKINLKNKKEPLVIIFDRFESLLSKRDTYIGLRDEEQWIFEEGGLIDSVPEVLWVIAGRERVKWLDEEGQKWKDSLKTWPLDPLEEKFAYKFLEAGGIPQELYGDLYKLTEGYPEYLIQCINLAHSIKDKNPSAELTKNEKAKKE